MAPSSAHCPFAVCDQDPRSKRSSRGSAPPKPVATSSVPSGRTLTQKRPFPVTKGCDDDPPFRQTSRRGGVSVTEQTAVAVNPVRPADPSEVTTFTAAAMPGHRVAEICLLHHRTSQPSEKASRGRRSQTFDGSP